MTNISINKLEKFLGLNEMVPSIYYVNNRMRCIFLEVFTINNNDSFIIYIPSKYSMIVDEHEKIVMIEKHKINPSGDIIDNYCPED